MTPAASIILPTYNRARFLPQALASIRAQRWTDWELIIVDDGSTDETPEIIGELTAGIAQPVKFIRQENQGAYGARNTGLDHATGRYIAFFDSDDEWLPHHLSDCVAALEANPDVDWVYGACRMVDDATGRVIAENTFYVDGKARPFLDLACDRRGELRIITDKRALESAIRTGFYAGLQNSLIRQSCFEAYRFHVERLHECEDRLFVLIALIERRRFGYFDNVHVVYRVHDGNSSATPLNVDLSKREGILNSLLRGRKKLLSDRRLQRCEYRALCERIAEEHFWSLGYSLFWENGMRRKSFKHFALGIVYSPFTWRYWKTTVTCGVKAVWCGSRPATSGRQL